MEILFRKYFWAVNLLFVALVALMAARLVNVFIGSALAPNPAGALVKPSSRPKAVEPVAMLELPRLASLLGLPLPEPEPEVEEPAAPDLNAEPVKSGLGVKLLGTLVASRPAWSIASIQNNADQKTTTYMVGDTIEGAQILEIERLRVIILNNGRKEFIDGDAGSGVAVAPPPAAPPQRVASAQTSNLGLGQGIRATGEGEYEVPRSEIDRTLSNLNDVAMQARIVPAFKDGVAQGFKLFSIRPDSIYTKIGIQNGDVIKRINGYDLNSPEKALEVYSKLKDSSRIDIEIERGGASMRKTYNVR